MWGSELLMMTESDLGIIWVMGREGFVERIVWRRGFGLRRRASGRERRTA